MTKEKTTKEKAMGKIKKLLALSESSNAHEAQAALLQAQRWMAKYKIEEGELEEGEEKKTTVLDATDPHRRVWWKGHLSQVIADNFNCYAYNQLMFGGMINIRFLGLEDDAELAVQVFRHASDMIEHYSKKYIRDRKRELEVGAGIDFKKDFETIDELENFAREQVHPSRLSRLQMKYGDNQKVYKMRLIMAIKDAMGISINGSALKNEYILGFIHGLIDKFEEQVKNEEWGLVLVKDQKVEDEYQNLNLSKSSASSAKRSGDARARQSGYKRGKSYTGTPAGHVE